MQCTYIFFVLFVINLQSYDNSVFAFEYFRKALYTHTHTYKIECIYTYILPV